MATLTEGQKLRLRFYSAANLAILKPEEFDKIIGPPEEQW